MAVLTDNPIFLSKGTKPQAHVKVQLACFLIWYGTCGSDIANVADKMDVGEGSVTNYGRRISRGVWELGPRFLKWPDNNRQAVTSDNIEAKSGLRLCLGSGDGSHVNQTSEPQQFSYMYQNRKQRFSVRGTTVLDCTGLTYF